MSVSIKTASEIEKMRHACHLLEQVHDELGKAIHPGMSTWEINKLGEEIIRSFGCIPNFLNYNGYPASICVSVNEEVVHEYRANVGSSGKAILSVLTPD